MSADPRPRIAIPMPHSFDHEYSARVIPQYEHAVQVAGGEPVRIPLDLSGATVKNLIEGCDAVLLPGSKADVNPAQFRATRSPHTADADPRRDEADHRLLQHAYAARIPVLGICYGLQSLNVYRAGSLVQHIPDFLPQATRGKVNHDAGKSVKVAHTVKVEENSRLASIMSGVVPVNSSHHQSADGVGEGLRVVARCAEDGIIEAIEGTVPDHFVVAVQWHPERSVDDDEPSRALFRAFVEAANNLRDNHKARR